ncbi:hypothetical protein GGI05_006615 [Coemansia sp. RSA 2603]|nr:hypothetical protein GGI05_006615 [Coemansia sp. RSA 2603]
MVTLPTCVNNNIPPVSEPKIAEPVDMVARLKLDPSLLQKAQAARAILQKHHLLGKPSGGQGAQQMQTTDHNTGRNIVEMQPRLASDSTLTVDESDSATPAALNQPILRDGSQNVGPNLEKLLATKRSPSISNAAAMHMLTLGSASTSPPYSPLTAVQPLTQATLEVQSQTHSMPTAAADQTETPPATAVEEVGGGHSEGINRLLGILAQVQKGTTSSGEGTAAEKSLN